MTNVDRKTVEGFGYEWSHFDQSQLDEGELRELFESYFDIFPWDALPPGASGMDVGCGSGRWAKCVAPRVGTLHCIDASEQALSAARSNLEKLPNSEFHLASVDALPLADASMDFGYAMGVLHHVPDTLAGLKECVRAIKPGAPFLLYLYYNLENRPLPFRLLWRVSDLLRIVISRLPILTRHLISAVMAAGVYWPLARTARLLETLGLPVDSWPLSFYRQRSFFVMRTDAFDRFATRLEKRFSAADVRELMTEAGLERIQISPRAPFWHALGYRKTSSQEGRT